MNKKILIASLCVSLTAISVLSAEANISFEDMAPKHGVSSPSSVLPPELAVGAPHSKKLSGDQIKKLMETRRAQEKTLMYDTLKLTEAQKAKAEALDAKTKSELKPLVKDLRQEMKKMQELKTKNASIIKIWKQQFAVNSAKSKVKSKLTASKNDFEAILTAEQKTQYKKIEADRHKKMQQFHKNHPGFGPKGMAPGPKGRHGFEHAGPPPSLEK